MEKPIDTATQILEVAQKLMQERGYNAFSYADIAEAVGIRKASIHYYFPAKSDLAKAVLLRYRANVRGLQNHVDRNASGPRQKLEWLVSGYAGMLEAQNLICLCGMLGAELPTLPEDVRQEVLGFFSDVHNWLVETMQAGVQDGSLQVEQPIEVEAHLFWGTVQGAMMLARAFNEPSRFTLACQRLIEHLAKS